MILSVDLQHLKKMEQSKTPTHELVKLELSLLCSLIGMLGCDSYTEKVMLLGRLSSIPSWDDDFVRQYVQGKLCEFKQIALRHGFSEPWTMDNSLLNIAFSTRTSFSFFIFLL